MRTTDAALVNALLNDPLIRPTIGGDGDLDATALLTDTRNVCLISEAGGMMFAWRGPKVFEVHIFYRARGQEAIAAANEMLCQFDDCMLWAPAPINRRDVRWFARKVGFVSHGLMDTPEGPCELFVR